MEHHTRRTPVTVTPFFSPPKPGTTAFWEEKARKYWALPSDWARAEQRIRDHAYYLSLEPKYQGKSQEDIWLAAEEEMVHESQEIKSQRAIRRVLARRMGIPTAQVNETTPLTETDRDWLEKDLSQETGNKVFLARTVANAGDLLLHLSI